MGINLGRAKSPKKPREKILVRGIKEKELADSLVELISNSAEVLADPEAIRKRVESYVDSMHELKTHRARSGRAIDEETQCHFRDGRGRCSGRMEPGSDFCIKKSHQIAAPKPKHESCSYLHSAPGMTGIRCGRATVNETIYCGEHLLEAARLGNMNTGVGILRHTDLSPV